MPLPANASCKRLQQPTARGFRCHHLALVPQHHRLSAFTCLASSSSNQGPAEEPGPSPVPQPQPAQAPLAPLAPQNNELPPELQDLSINEDGFLIDTKTGKVINEFGATRFDVAVRALRDELSPPEWVEDTERAHGNLLAALFTFPRPYEFQVVAKPDARGRDALLADVRAAVCRVCEVDAGDAGVAFDVKERLGGKYVSVSMTLTVRAPEIVTLVYEALEKDERVKMRF